MHIYAMLFTLLSDTDVPQDTQPVIESKNHPVHDYIKFKKIIDYLSASSSGERHIKLITISCPFQKWGFLTWLLACKKKCMYKEN
jgi:hypothetical protein